MERGRVVRAALGMRVLQTLAPQHRGGRRGPGSPQQTGCTAGPQQLEIHLEPSRYTQGLELHWQWGCCSESPWRVRERTPEGEGGQPQGTGGHG